ncbi:MAG: hypothetical protein AAF621_04225 [Pseudomonadota bacterium]
MAISMMGKKGGKGMMFKFPGVNYPNQMGISKSLKAHNLKEHNRLLYACVCVSILWCGLVLAYGMGIIASYPGQTLPVFVMVSLAIICIFPTALIWAGYMVYKHILSAQETGAAVLEAARVLASPALVAAGDVQSLSAAVAEELNHLKHGMREIEERVQHFSKSIAEEVGGLKDAGDHLEKAAERSSAIIYKERDTLIDILKLLKNETKPQPLSEPTVTREIKPQIVRQNIDVVTRGDKTSDMQDDVSTRLDQIIKQENDAGKATQESFNMSQDMSDDGGEDVSEDARKPVSFTMSDVQPLSEAPENYILRKERQLYEGLYALTVDLNRVFDTGAPHELWPRYMRGERNVFAEYFCEWAQKSYDAYRRAAAQDEFRKIANRFIAQFETLRERLFDTPHTEVSEFLERSGIGRIYNLLSAEYV